MSALTVTVSGLPGSGKTTVAIAIRNALTDLGFSVSLEDVDSCPEDEQRAKIAIKQLPLYSDILVKTQEYRRGPIGVHKTLRADRCKCNRIKRYCKCVEIELRKSL